MNPEMKKALGLTAAFIGMLFLGAFGMWGVSKLTSPTPVAVPAATVSAQTQPVPAVAAPAGSQVVANQPVVEPNPAPPGYVMAQVINVQPHYVLKSVAYRSCHDQAETVYEQRGSEANTGVGAVMGGVAGGLLGNTVGQGRGRQAATIGGAVLGLMAGNQVESNMHQPQARTIYRPVCHTAYTKKSVRSGYEVTYFYNGQQGMKIMANRPTSNMIPLSLQAVPVD